MAIKEFDEEELTIDDYDESLFDDEESDEGDEPGINTIEYIESSGAGNSGQYIDTGIKGSSKLRIVTDMLPIKAGIQFFYGARLGDSSTNAFLFVCEQSTGTKFRFDYSVTKRYITEVYDKKMHIDQNKNTFTVTDEDGNSLGSNTVGINTFSLEQNVYIFALNQGGSSYNHAKMRLYGMKIYDDDVLVRDFVPALDPEGVPCLYDQVTETYFMNKGSGSFSYPQ